MPSIENDLGGDLLERLLDQDERERAMSKVQLENRLIVSFADVEMQRMIELLADVYEIEAQTKLLQWVYYNRKVVCITRR